MTWSARVSRDLRSVQAVAGSAAMIAAGETLRSREISKRPEGYPVVAASGRARAGRCQKAVEHYLGGKNTSS